MDDPPSPSLLLLGSQIEIGGAQQILRLQAGWFQRHGVSVTAAFLYDKEGLFGSWQSEADYPLIDLGAWRKGDSLPTNFKRLLGGLARLWRLLRSRRWSAIETFTPHANLIGIPLAWLAGVPVRIGSYHGRVGNPTRWLDYLHGRLANSPLMTLLVAVSPQAMQYAEMIDGVHPERIRVILNGIEVPEIVSDRKAVRRRMRVELGISEEQFLVFTAGRLVPQKGHRCLIEAAAIVHARLPAAVFVLAGEGPERQALTAQIAGQATESYVRLLGSRSDVPDLLAAADLFVLPSLSEGMGLAMVEAMAHGLPVVASRLAGIESVIEGEHLGLLVPPGDAQLLAKALLTLLEDPPRRAALAAQGRAHVRRHFTLDAMCQEYQRLLFPGA